MIQTNQNYGVQDLPLDAWRGILHSFSPAELLNIQSASKRIYLACSMQPLWKNHFEWLTLGSVFYIKPSEYKNSPYFTACDIAYGIIGNEEAAKEQGKKWLSIETNNPDYKSEVLNIWRLLFPRNKQKATFSIKIPKIVSSKASKKKNKTASTEAQSAHSVKATPSPKSLDDAIEAIWKQKIIDKMVDDKGYGINKNLKKLSEEQSALDLFNEMLNFYDEKFINPTLKTDWNKIKSENQTLSIESLNHLEKFIKTSVKLFLSDYRKQMITKHGL